MVIQVEFSDTGSGAEDPLVRAVGMDKIFNSQLYLFETMGVLISMLNQVPDQQVSLLRVSVLS
jgi:exportin-T